MAVPPEREAAQPPTTVTPVVADPAPAPARVWEPPATRAEIQRARRSRRLRTRFRLAVAGAGLGAALFLAKAYVVDAAPPETTAEPEAAGAGTPLDGGEPTAEPMEPTGLRAAPSSHVIPPPVPAPIPVPPPPPPPLPNEATWDRMAQCETGGNWQHRGPTWSGGLGIYRGTWQEAGGTEFAALPRDATREEQIIVAERIRERHGWSAWGCAASIGLR